MGVGRVNGTLQGIPDLSAGLRYLQATPPAVLTSIVGQLAVHNLSHLFLCIVHKSLLPYFHPTQVRVNDGLQDLLVVTLVIVGFNSEALPPHGWTIDIQSL